MLNTQIGTRSKFPYKNIIRLLPPCKIIRTNRYEEIEQNIDDQYYTIILTRIIKRFFRKTKF